MSEVNAVVPRRERIFNETQDEIAAVARQLVVDQGVEAVTIRAVASGLGMTGPALYRYFQSREEILERVTANAYADLAAYLIDERERHRQGTVRDRLIATSWAFRRWALEHRAEFGLLFGAPIPGISADAADDEIRGLDFAKVWVDLMVEVHRTGARPRWPYPLPERLHEQMVAFIARIGADIPIDIAVLYLYCWQSLYGSVCTEVFGHLTWALDDASEFFAGRLLELADLLGLPADDDAA